MNSENNKEEVEKLLDIFHNFSKREEHLKDVQLLKEGSVCRKLYFVEKGILRFYYYNEQGKDITHWFLIENDFITEIDSFLLGKTSEYYIETLEDSVVYSITLHDFKKLTNLFPEVESLINTILTKFLLEMGEKIKDLQFRDATTRYANLLAKNPDILQRVALGHIASYLGITQQSLSRIRKKK